MSNYQNILNRARLLDELVDLQRKPESVSQLTRELQRKIATEIEEYLLKGCASPSPEVREPRSDPEPSGERHSETLPPFAEIRSCQQADELLGQGQAACEAPWPDQKSFEIRPSQCAARLTETSDHLRVIVEVYPFAGGSR